MSNIVAISGASGRTGFRIAEEALAQGRAVRLLVRPASRLPPSLAHCDIRRLDFGRLPQLVEALAGCHSLVMATGAISWGRSRWTPRVYNGRCKPVSRPAWGGWCW